MVNFLVKMVKIVMCFSWHSNCKKLPLDCEIHSPRSGHTLLNGKDGETRALAVPGDPSRDTAKTPTSELGNK